MDNKNCIPTVEWKFKFKVIKNNYINPQYCESIEKINVFPSLINMHLKKRSTKPESILVTLLGKGTIMIKHN